MAEAVSAFWAVLHGPYAPALVVYALFIAVVALIALTRD